MYTNLLRRLAAILALVVGISVLTALLARAVTELKVMSWNVKTQDSAGLGVAREIAEEDVDVAGLQEVCHSDVQTIEAPLRIGWSPASTAATA